MNQMNRSRQERLQIMLNPEERRAIDDWRFDRRMPSRAAAVRELLRRGLESEGFQIAAETARSGEFGVLSDESSQEGSGA
jgi:Arc/MetJ-type ribon-helix-helix transcriptional regulator